MPLFRVHFNGPPLPDHRFEAEFVGAEWEVTYSFPDDAPELHYFLVDADTAEDAVGTLRGLLESHGGFEGFVASELTPPPGWNGIGRDVERPDWDEVAHRCELTELEMTLLGNLLHAAEPTWIVLQDPDTPDDRDLVESAFRQLERRGLVSSTSEASGKPDGSAPEPENWWELTDQAWELMGMIKPP